MAKMASQCIIICLHNKNIGIIFDEVYERMLIYLYCPSGPSITSEEKSLWGTFSIVYSPNTDQITRSVGHRRFYECRSQNPLCMVALLVNNTHKNLRINTNRDKRDLPRKRRLSLQRGYLLLLFLLFCPSQVDFKCMYEAQSILSCGEVSAQPSN